MTVEATTLFVTLLIIPSSGLILIVGGWVPVQNGHVALCILWCFAMSQYSLKEYTSNNFFKCHPLTCTHCENCSHHLLQSQSHPECAYCESHRAQLRNRDLIFTKRLTTEEEGTIGRLSLNQGDYQDVKS